MKKTNLFMLLLILVIWGCSPLDDSGEFPELSDARIEQIFTLKDDEQKLAFEMLNSKEKAKVWTLSISNALSQDYFTNEQKILVKELTDFIGEDMPQDENLISTFKDSWLKKAEGVLDEDQIYSVAYKVNNRIGMKTEDPNDPTGTKCNCHRGSAFTCGFTIEWYCPDATSTCKNPTMTGCGFMFWYSCNQICETIGEV